MKLSNSCCVRTIAFPLPQLPVTVLPAGVSPLKIRG